MTSTKATEALTKLLADSYTVYLKTHNFHWNVKGPFFETLHSMFETQYTELAGAVDEIAERIRALGEQAPGSYKEFSQLTSIVESTGSVGYREMTSQLLEGQETVIRTARSVLPLAQDATDEASVDLLVGRIQLHEKTAWMLRSTLED